jgi:hypothetical protein
VRPFAWKDQFPKVNPVSPTNADDIRRKWQWKMQFLSSRRGI